MKDIHYEAESSYRENAYAGKLIAPHGGGISLLDRLTDNEPEKKTESTGNSIISPAALKDCVLRDLQWLFNTINHEAQRSLAPFEFVRKSVINFGIASLAGKHMSDIEWNDISRKLKEAIIFFEPRILAQGLFVYCISDPVSLGQHNILSIEIKGQLLCEPYPLSFLFRTDVDIENNYFELNDMG